MWNINGMTRFLARVLLAAFAAGTIAIVVDGPAAVAQMAANKPHGGVDCVPVGVTTDSKGVVWALENCNGDIFRHRMSPIK
jgi:hypothetical protein